MISSPGNFQVSDNFWHDLQQLVETSEVIIDRPQGTPHPNYPDYIHPVGYGYLKDTLASDNSEMDIWVGSSDSRTVEGILCTIDLDKRDAEIKILFSCTDYEIDEIYELQSQGNMSVVLVRR